MTVAPYGSWSSPITAELLVQEAVSLSQPQVAGDAVYWAEGRPAEGGRQVVMRRKSGATPEEVLPAGFNARTTVHEYGGGSYAVHGDTLYFSNFADQRLYRLDGGGQPAPITPEPPAPRAIRYADGDVTPDGTWIACVRETHLDSGEVVNDLVVVPTDAHGDPRLLTAGHDFFAAPRVSPDGRRLAWLSWDHPCMPWDGTDLWVGDLDHAGTVSGTRRLAGGADESVSQPRWAPDGTLYWISDRSGWWNLFTESGPLVPMEAEFAGPDWVFGQCSYAVLDDGRIVTAWSREGITRLGVVLPGPPQVVPLEVECAAVVGVRPYRDGVAAIVGSTTEEPAVVTIDVGETQGGSASATVEVLKRARPVAVDARYLSVPQPIEFPSERGRTAHALYYPPANGDHEGPAGERPPLVVMSHGGPTSSASPTLSLRTQYWTSRGLAVVDVNYGGSTGYGREYRERLDGQWGVVDVDDCISAARHLAEAGEVDPARLVIRGGSAGGYTTLCALTFHDVFAAGASYYGVADAEALAVDTHKFESRYLDRLIGPYPAAAELYRQRSPIRYADRLSAPLIIFQGLEDKVVPPSQAEVMVEALRAKSVPVAYLTFADEQHGFRRAETIVRATEAELTFYGQVLGFEPADDIEPVVIENLGSWSGGVDGTGG